MKRQGVELAVIGVIGILFVPVSYADDLSIYQVQYTPDSGGDSPYDGQIHSVDGGIVTHVWHGFNDRVYLQDPAHATWGAVVVKDREDGELSNNVNIGDWVSFDDILIKEYRGTTFLQYDRAYAPSVSFTIESTGNDVPLPVLLTAADLPVPVDHGGSEPYESMVVKVQDVTVGQRDLGKAADNYELIQGSDLAWGTDYMNVDIPHTALYDPRIVTGASLWSVTGIVEQYTKSSSGWNYYQLCTRSAADIRDRDSIPTVSEWGLIALALLLLTAGKVMFGRPNRYPA